MNVTVLSNHIEEQYNVAQLDLNIHVQHFTPGEQ